MKLTDVAEITLAIFTIWGMISVGKSNIRKQLITDLQALVLAHEQTINSLKAENVRLRADSVAKDERICALEETIDGYSELVRKGHLLGGSGPRSRNGATAPKTTKNRTP